MTKKSESYEVMLKNLDTIVEKMDNGDMSLEENLKNYEEGIKLCNTLFKVLKDAEGKISILSNGEVKDFIKSEEDTLGEER